MTPTINRTGFGGALPPRTPPPSPSSAGGPLTPAPAAAAGGAALPMPPGGASTGTAGGGPAVPASFAAPGGGPGQQAAPPGLASDPSAPAPPPPSAGGAGQQQGTNPTALRGQPGGPPAYSATNLGPGQTAAMYGAGGIFNPATYAADSAQQPLGQTQAVQQVSNARQAPAPPTNPFSAAQGQGAAPQQAQPASIRPAGGYANGGAPPTSGFNPQSRPSMAPPSGGMRPKTVV